MLNDHVEYITINEKSQPKLTKFSPYIWQEIMEINSVMQKD